MTIRDEIARAHEIFDFDTRAEVRHEQVEEFIRDYAPVVESADWSDADTHWEGDDREGRRLVVLTPTRDGLLDPLREWVIVVGCPATPEPPTLAVGDRTLVLPEGDDTARLVAADCLQEAGREEEAGILRDGRYVIRDDGVHCPHEGWAVSLGFLDGNLGGEECCRHAASYAGHLQEALETRFPGATVTVHHQDSAGSPPQSYRAAVFDADDEDRSDEFEREIGRIAEDVLMGYAWMPGAAHGEDAEEGETE